MADTELPPAPASAVDREGRINLGRYAGRTGPIDWTGAGPGRLWRLRHWKRWQYACVIGDDHVAALAIVDLGWATTAFAYLFDRRSARVLADLSFEGLPRVSGRVADHVGVGARSAFRRGGTRLAIEHAADGWLVSAQGRGLTIEATLEADERAATICAIARVPGGIASCTHKTHGLRVRGTARSGEEAFDLAGSMAALDHTSGLLARRTAWRWASAVGPGVAINLVDGFQEPLENAVWLGGRIRPLPPVLFERDSAAPLATWRVRSDDDAVDLVFRPEGVRSQDKNLGFAASRFVQPIGIFTGTVLGQDVGRLSGVLEDHDARW